MFSSRACVRSSKIYSFILEHVYFIFLGHNNSFYFQVTELRTYIYNDINLGDTWNENKVPAYSFSDSSKDLWEKIKQNEKLDLPTHKVLGKTSSVYKNGRLI